MISVIGRELTENGSANIPKSIAAQPMQPLTLVPSFILADVRSTNFRRNLLRPSAKERFMHCWAQFKG